LISVAILGAGFMGGAHAANYKRLEDRVRVKRVVARSLDRAARVADVVGAVPSTDLEEAVLDPEIDAVDICLPTLLHREIAERAFSAAKDVFLEKPIALTSEDADAIIRAANESGRLFMVGLVLRFWPEYVELQRLVAARELGQPLVVSAHRLSPPADWNDWMKDEAQSGGVAVDLSIHDFDQLNWLLGEPRRVFARASRPGHLVATVEYDGALGLVEGSMLMPKSSPFSSNIRVLCEGGVAEYSFSAAPAEDGGNIGASDTWRGLRLYPAGGEPTTVAVDSADPWGPEIAYFVECVEQRREPEHGTGEQAKKALLVSLAARRSLETGRPEGVYPSSV
jgi:predicted dehydrogenase